MPRLFSNDSNFGAFVVATWQTQSFDLINYFDSQYLFWNIFFSFLRKIKWLLVCRSIKLKMETTCPNWPRASASFSTRKSGSKYFWTNATRSTARSPRAPSSQSRAAIISWAWSKKLVCQKPTQQGIKVYLFGASPPECLNNQILFKKRSPHFIQRGHLYKQWKERLVWHVRGLVVHQESKF